MSKVRKLISIATIFSMCLTSIYGYAGDATHYGMKNPIVAQSPMVQPPVVGAVLKGLGDNQFCISSTIGNPDLVPSIFTEANKSYETEITDIINTFSSIGVPLCTAEPEERMKEGVQYVNTFLVDSEVYSNQKRITLVDRIRGVVNNDIKIKTTGGLMTAWPFELFHFQVPSFTSTTDEEIAASMETAIEEVQGVYTRVFSNSNEREGPSQKEKPSFRGVRNFERCGVTAVTGVVAGAGVVMVGMGIIKAIDKNLIPSSTHAMVLGLSGVVMINGGVTIATELGNSVSDLICGVSASGVSAGGLTFLLLESVTKFK